MRYDAKYLMCTQKLERSQLSLPNRKLTNKRGKTKKPMRMTEIDKNAKPEKVL